MTTRSFKSDDSFLEKISIGAIGAQKVFEDLINQGHQPIELERGSRSFKIWKDIKIKRIRVPDFLLVNNGVRVESRAKTKFELSMSHSQNNPERGWDYGLKDEDYVAVVVCEKVGDSPIAWQPQNFVQYFNVGDMRKIYAEGKVGITIPKGAREGFEVRLIWYTSSATYSGKIVEIDDKKIKFCRDLDKRVIPANLIRKNVETISQVTIGEQVVVNQILSSLVPVYTKIPNLDSVDFNYYLRLGKSYNLTERYTAVKALSSYCQTEVIEFMHSRIAADDEHIYVKMEAAKNLSLYGVEEGWKFIIECLQSSYRENQLEAVIILAELNSERAVMLLGQVLADNNKHVEIRSGAAWALGELNKEPALGILINTFISMNDEIKEEAARSLSKMSNSFDSQLTELFISSNTMSRPGIAWALADSGKFNYQKLIAGSKDVDSRQWLSFIIGNQDNDKYIKQIEEIKTIDPEVYFAVTLLWKITQSWISNLTMY